MKTNLKRKESGVKDSRRCAYCFIIPQGDDVLLKGLDGKDYHPHHLPERRRAKVEGPTFLAMIARA